MSDKVGVRLFPHFDLLQPTVPPMHNPELPVATAIAAVLVLIPVPSQLRLRNIPVLALLGGTFFLNAIYLVNTLVWAGNTHDVAPVWCDIATNLQFYFPLLGEGAALCICRQLEWRWSTRGASSAARPRQTLFEVSMCFIVPLISIPIRYSLSSNRYVVLETFGCSPGFDLSAISVAFISGPELAVVSVGFVYACLAIRNLIRRRRTSKSNSIRITQSAFTTSRFVRLLAVCIIIGAWPLIAVLLCLYSLSSNLVPWRGWATVHAHFSNIPRIPLFAQPPWLRQSFMTIVWVDIITSYLSFVILICTEDVHRDVGDAWRFFSGLASSFCFWKRCGATPTRRPRARESVPASALALAHAPSSQWLESSSGSGLDGNVLKMLMMVESTWCEEGFQHVNTHPLKEYS